MPYPAIALISVVLFAAVHLFAERTQNLSLSFRSKLLSLGGGVAIAYVFVDLLPKLAKSDLIVQAALSGIFPYFERHVYVMALIGFLLFFIVGRSHTFLGGKGSFWLSLLSYGLFNFLVGYAVVDKDNPEVRPLAFFTIAIALHYFVNDFSMSQAHGKEYDKFGKYFLVLCLFLGWFTGNWIVLSQTAIALVSAFIGGGVIMNVTRHELPEGNPNSLTTFVLSAVLYTAILLTIG